MFQEEKTMSDVNSRHTIPSKTMLISKPKWSRCRIIKNLMCISCGNFLIHTGYKGISQLQSTMNSQENMGLTSQATIFVFFGLSALFLPTITIKKLGYKLTITLSLLAYCPYIASNFYPEWLTLIPSAALLGLSGSLLWASLSTYLNKLSVIFNKNVGGESVESVAALFFGILFTFYQISFICGNLISFLVLEHQQLNSVSVSETHCGVNFSENDVGTRNNTNLETPRKDSRDILTGILFGLGVLAVLLIALVLDPLQYVEDEVCSLTKRLTATFRIMQRKNQILLIPLVLYNGMQGGFYIADFTKAYIACSWSVYHIGLVTMCLGLSSAICSTASGRLQKYTGRIPLFATAASASICTFVQLFIWTPDPAKPYLFFVCVSIWGIFNGIYLTEISAFYGELFRDEEESAFANFYLWYALGHGLSFSYSRYLRITTKLYLMIILFCLAQVGYTAVEYNLRNLTQNGKGLSHNEQTNSRKCRETEEYPVL